MARKLLRDQQGEIGVDVAGFLEAAVEVALDGLPDRVAVGPDDHAAADRRIIGELRGLDDVEVPLGVIVGAGFDVLGHEDSCVGNEGFFCKGGGLGMQGGRGPWFVVRDS